MTIKQLTLIDLEEKRLALHAELSRARALDAAKHGEKISKDKDNFMANIEDKFKNLRDAFSKMDQDQSGSLDREEMGQLCVQFNIPEEYIVELINEADKDGDGEIGYIEFVQALERKSQLGNEAEDAAKITLGCSSDPTTNNNNSVRFSGTYRSGPSLPPAMKPAGVNFDTTGASGDNLFSAHASHFSRSISKVLEDGVGVCCARRPSYHIKSDSPNFLK